MLLKCQVPSVQYISLTTINRIFDIYVYHNLFYPGFYESCYIPLAKRQANRTNQKNLIEASLFSSSAATAAADELSQATGQTLTVGSSSFKHSKMKKLCVCETPDVWRAKSHSPTAVVGGSGVRLASKFNKERNSTIHENPSDEEQQQQLAAGGRLGFYRIQSLFFNPGGLQKF